MDVEDSLSAGAHQKQAPPQDDAMSDDDNAQPDVPEEEPLAEEDPLWLAIEDLEGRVVSSLDDVKMHPGIARTFHEESSASPAASRAVAHELATLLRPVLEVAAHTGPSVARTYFRGDADAAMETVYERTVSDLTLPVLLEMAQSDSHASKRAAALEFFRTLWNEWHKTGSWLDSTPNQGPYAATTSLSSTALPFLVSKRRREKRLAREAELLRYWVQAAVACTSVLLQTRNETDAVMTSRGIVAAAAALRPSLAHMVARIQDADDRGANRLYTPVMKMIEGVLKTIFLQPPHESVLAAAIKFLEIVVLCCSRKPAEATRGRPSQRKGTQVCKLNRALDLVISIIFSDAPSLLVFVAIECRLFTG
jgi:hypothetical protein